MILPEVLLQLIIVHGILEVSKLYFAKDLGEKLSEDIARYDSSAGKEQKRGSEFFSILENELNGL